MTGFLHMRFPAFLTAVACLLLAACEEPGEEEAKFLVNRETGNSTVSVSPGGGESQLFVECDAEWDYKFQSAASWLTVTDRPVNSHSWMLTLTAQEYLGTAPRSAKLVFTSGTRVREVTVTQDPEDPIVQVSVPGAYGVEGGDVLYRRTQSQISRLSDGDSYQFSLLFPSQVKVVSISVPMALEEGNQVALSYKVVEKDRTLVKTDYPSAKVVRIREPYVWLKVSDTVYFVIKK